MHQVKIGVFIGSNYTGKFRKKVTPEVNVPDESNKQILVSSSEFDDRESGKCLKLRTLMAEVSINNEVIQMLGDELLNISKGT